MKLNNFFNIEAKRMTGIAKKKAKVAFFDLFLLAHNENLHNAF